MPDTVKIKVKSGQSTDNVTIINRHTMRPVIFRIPGKTIRLGPGEKVELPAICESSRELGSLVRSGAVKMWRNISENIIPKKKAQKIIKESEEVEVKKQEKLDKETVDENSEGKDNVIEDAEEDELAKEKNVKRKKTSSKKSTRKN